MKRKNGQSNMKKKFGYKNEHHLLVEKVEPESLTRLRRLLALPHNKDISDAAKRGQTFEECLGIIAACLSIALDGYYDVPDLCDMLCRAITARTDPGRNPEQVHPNLVQAQLVEKADTISLELGAKTHVSKTEKELEIEANNTFMQERGCAICNQIKICRNNNRCLGNKSEVLEEAYKNAADAEKSKTVH